MATNPAEHAESAHAALRMLAEATRDIEDPDQLSAVIHDLRGGMRALQTTLAQLADAHTAHQGRAISLRGDLATGRATAADAYAVLREAAQGLGGVEELLREAVDLTDHIDWTPAPTAPVVEEIDPSQAHRSLSERGVWRTVTLQEGTTAARTMRLLDEHGAEAAVAYLAQADHGDPTIRRELERGYAYDEPPPGRERVFQVGAYQLSINPEGRWAGLSHWDEPGQGPTLAPPLPQALHPTTPSPGPGRHRDHAATRGRADASWFEHPGSTTGRRAPGPGL
ncbi:hypothetical protein [Kocuria sp. 2SI]|uniref:hypothetical protein n=1 Tax=Kocuria sp. 2SI TaxID=2502203 RepID=UPI0010F975B2|nr:hypothetical protein [Kocuria sp. 2SI]